MASVNDKIALAIITVVNDNGQLTSDEIVSTVRELDGFDEIEPKAINNQVVKLDRDGKLTRANAESGWQLTANGRGALDGLRAKMEARYIAPYSAWVPVDVTVMLLSPSLGPITEPGNQGIARFPRLGEEYTEKVTPAKGRDPEKIERIVTNPGQVMMYGGWIRAAMNKAAGKGDATVLVDGAGARRTLPDVAWSHVNIKSIIFPADQKMTRSVRRPTNARGQSVGEIIHESLPAGTVLHIRGSFPSSHFSEMYLVRLMSQVEDTGISAAGTGKGGIWGVCAVSSLKINGREVWPGAEGAQEARPGQMEDVAITEYQTIAEAEAEAADPRSRLVAGSTRTVNGAGNL